MFEQLENRQFLSVTGAIARLGPQLPVANGAVNQQLQIRNGAQGQTQTGVALAPLTAVEAADLQAIARDEKLARDVYTAMYARWGNTVFRNIAASEQQHLNAVSNLLTKYKIANPVAALPAGRFDTAEMQNLYDQFIAQGNQSRAAAFEVGVEIEEFDIEALQVVIQRTTHTDVKNVYTNLLSGSRSHLAAFTRQLALLESLK